MQPKRRERRYSRPWLSRDFAADFNDRGDGGAAALLDAMQIKGFISARRKKRRVRQCADVIRSRAPELLSENAHTPFPCTHFHSRAQVVPRRATAALRR
ncbi:hypothetical protein ALC56_08041 [Trachymyrmex septentrionalis]|uniref:Uncharacterized protein n=1 Tax=Trachymyrmex septentrionalis TaxID=34720 RepID=A0A195FCB2_9HYME|nr:hypothetical protein ALC56_08041 [Trachymyrmex septentrionalis]